MYVNKQNMKRSILIIPISIILVILFYPTTSNSNSTGSIGGKTGSPSDASSCTQCHYGGIGTGATITSNIPISGYIPNQIYTITATIQGSKNQYGFEITAEESSLVTSSKTGNFLITNNLETKLTNNNNAVTHKLGGVQGIGMKSWSMDWEAPNSGSGPVTFWGAFIEGNDEGNNTGDTYHSTDYSVEEGIINSLNKLYSENEIKFNSITKTIKSLDNALLSVYNLEGEIVLSSKKKYTSLSHLTNGIYIIKSQDKTKKIILN